MLSSTAVKKGKKKRRSNKEESKEEKRRAAEVEAEAESRAQARVQAEEAAMPKIVCDVCGLKETSRGTDRNCCHKGGSWYGSCGRKADKKAAEGSGAEVHTFREGFRVCHNASRAK